LNKEVYSLKQEGCKISDYYTKMKAIWEELDAMNELPQLTTVAIWLMILLSFCNVWSDSKMNKNCFNS